ncbi:T9SS type B sorting domain-containing protein [Schleiferia thermophila]
MGVKVRRIVACIAAALSMFQSSGQPAEILSDADIHIMRDEGQYNSGIKRPTPVYYIRHAGALMEISSTEWRWYYAADSQATSLAVSSLKFKGALQGSKLEEVGQGSYFERHYTVHDDGRPIYSVRKLRVCNLYAGIDLEMVPGQSGLRYEFIAQPGADLSAIQMEFSSDLSIELTPQGSYIAKSSRISFADEIPYIVLPDGSKMAGRFSKKGQSLTFDFRPAADLFSRLDRPFIIDPQIVWSTYYTGQGSDGLLANTIDSSRNIIAVGSVSSVFSANLSTPGSHQPQPGGGTDAIIVKFDRCGRRLWATYYGGTILDFTTGVAPDPINNIYVAGQTTSNNQIATAGSHQPAIGGQSDLFLVKFNENGQRLWATYYGGMQQEQNASVAVNYAGTRVVLYGTTNSNNNISTTGSHQPTLAGQQDAFFAIFDSSGTRLNASYFGGTQSETSGRITFDANDCFYFCGSTNSTANIASTGAYQTTLPGTQAGFFAKFTINGARVFSSYYGGTGNDQIFGITVRNQHLYIAGNTNSPTNIATPGSFMPMLPPGGAGFLVRFDTSGTTRHWGTYYGGNNSSIVDLATDIAGNVFFAGTTSANNLATPGSQFPNQIGFQDIILGRFEINGTRTWASYYGGTGNDDQPSITFGLNNTVILSCRTFTLGSQLGIFGFQNSPQGPSSGALARFFATPLHLEIRAVSKTSLCPEEIFTVAFIGGGFGAPTTVFAELSDQNFSFATPTLIGQIPNYTTGGSSITCQIPITVGSGQYLIRIRSQNPVFSSIHYCDTLQVLADGQLSLLSAKDTLCPGDTDTLSIANYSSGSITWYLNGNTIPGANQPVLPANQPGNYYAQVLSNSCLLTTDTVVLHQGVQDSITWSGFPDLCVNSPSITLNQASPPGGTYSGPGVTGNTFDPSIAGVGKHPIEYFYVSPVGSCVSISYDTIEVFPTYSQTLTGSLCTGETLTLPDGQVVSQTGIYTVNLLSEQGCDSTLVYIITVTPPSGQLLPPDTNLCPGQTLTLDPGLFASYLWNTGDTTRTITVSERGFYSVIVRDDLGCIYTDSILVSFDCFPVIFVPNAFSPNDDRRNDRFRVSISEYITYFEMIIFNRWGEVVFQTYTADFEWDGTYRGQKLPQGQYPYRIIYEYEINGSRHRKQEYGTLTILR